jgi:hypothetical protein
MKIGDLDHRILGRVYSHTEIELRDMIRVQARWDMENNEAAHGGNPFGEMGHMPNGIFERMNQ